MTLHKASQDKELFLKVKSRSNFLKDVYLYRNIKVFINNDIIAYVFSRTLDLGVKDICFRIKKNQYCSDKRSKGKIRQI